MGALEMISAVCAETGICTKCPFVNDNMLTPEEKEQIAGNGVARGFDDCYFELPPDAWDKELMKEAIKNEESVADGNNSQD